MQTRQERDSYDPARCRKAQRYGAEKGVRINIPAAELRKAGIDPDGPPPFYKVWGSKSGSVLVRFYREA